MRVHLKLFAILRDRAGTAEATLELPAGATVQQAAEAILARYPALTEHGRQIAYAVNRSYALGDVVLHDDDELALIPPVSGG